MSSFRTVERGALKWEGRSEPSGASKPTLLDLLRRVTDWPTDGFAKDWFVYDYRLLTVIVVQPSDTNVTITCHSRPSLDDLQVRISAHVRSTGALRQLTRKQLQAAPRHGFKTGDDEVVVATGDRRRESPDRLAQRLKAVIDEMFGPYCMESTYELVRDTRLDLLPVFMAIQPSELLTLAQSLGHEAELETTDADSVALLVAQPRPFVVTFLDRSEDGGFSTLLFTSGVVAELAPDDLNRLNRSLPVGSCWPEADGVLRVSLLLRLSGGATDVFIANRFDDWTRTLDAVTATAREVGATRAGEV